MLSISLPTGFLRPQVNRLGTLWSGPVPFTGLLEEQLCLHHQGYEWRRHARLKDELIRELLTNLMVKWCFSRCPARFSIWHGRLFSQASCASLELSDLVSKTDRLILDGVTHSRFHTCFKQMSNFHATNEVWIWIFWALQPTPHPDTGSRYSDSAKGWEPGNRGSVLVRDKRRLSSP